MDFSDSFYNETVSEKNNGKLSSGARGPGFNPTPKPRMAF